MCYGALSWSGISALLYAAGREDVESILGFDEGPLPDDWQHQLGCRDIRVCGGLLRGPACDVLSEYKAKEGIIY